MADGGGLMQLVTLLGLEAICSGELAIRMVAMKGREL